MATSIPLAFGDAIAVSLAVLTSAGLVWIAGGSTFISAPVSLALLVGLLLASIGCGLYPAIGLASCAELRKTSLAVTGAFLIPAAAWLAHSNGLVLIPQLAVAWLLALVIVPWMRSNVRTVCRRFDWWCQPVLIVASGCDIEEIYQSLVRRRKQGLRPIGWAVHPHSQWNDDLVDSTHCLGTTVEAAAICQSHNAFWAYVAMPDLSRYDANRVIDDQLAGVPHLLITCDTLVRVALATQTRDCGGKICWHLKRRLLLPLPRLAKRVLDLAVALTGAVAIVPVTFVLSSLIALSSAGNVLYGQQRIGRGGRKFNAWKFRSMVSNADQVLHDYLAKHPELREEWARDHKLKNDPRVTRIGKFIRKSSLDELPQIWNVIRGDMSLVGPRPIVQAEIAKYQETYYLYAQVRPGISGLWQVSGRNNTTYEERLACDRYYVENWSPWLDLYILARTIRVVLLREGAY